jgi:hypothetical protein
VRGPTRGARPGHAPILTTPRHAGVLLASQIVDLAHAKRAYF